MPKNKKKRTLFSGTVEAISSPQNIHVGKRKHVEKAPAASEIHDFPGNLIDPEATYFKDELPTPFAFPPQSDFFNPNFQQQSVILPPEELSPFFPASSFVPAAGEFDFAAEFANIPPVSARIDSNFDTNNPFFSAGDFSETNF